MLLSLFSFTSWNFDLQDGSGRTSLMLQVVKMCECIAFERILKFLMTILNLQNTQFSVLCACGAVSV